jgi:hypothetical protein
VSAPKLDGLKAQLLRELPTVGETIERIFAEFFLANPELNAGPPLDEEAAIDAEIAAEIAKSGS